MLLKHSNDLPSTSDTFSIGELAATLPAGMLFTKNINGQLIRINPGIFNLIDTPEFSVDTLYQNSILKLQSKDSQVTLTTILPIFSLAGLGGVELDSNLTIENYLGVDGSGHIINKPKPEFNLMGLSDVLTVPLTSDLDNYSLTFVYSPFPIQDTDKDFYATPTYGNWRLLPEATKITTFSDVYTILPNYIINYPEFVYLVLKVVSDPPPSNLQGYKVQLYGLEIEIDKNPTLSSNLDSNQNSIYNLGYKEHILSLTHTIESVSLDISTASCFILNCSDDVIELNLDISHNIELNTIKYIQVSLINLKGYLKLNSNIRFENGQPPILTGVNTMLSFMLYSDIDGVKITCLQKSNNLLKIEE
jgi:hypothetical protein